MEIKIATFQKGTPAQEFLPLITDAHNLRYSHAEKNCLYFQIFRFPYKEMTKAVAGHEDGTVKFMKSYIRAAVKRQETVLQFVFRYQVEKMERRKSGELKRRSIIKKERVFLIEADKSEIIQLVKPFLVELENVNSEKDAALYLNSFQEWAHPLTLESVTAELTEEQKLIAAKMLKAYFAA